MSIRGKFRPARMEKKPYSCRGIIKSMYKSTTAGRFQASRLHYFSTEVAVAWVNWKGCVQVNFNIFHPQETTVFVHSVILAAKSDYFACLFSTSGMKETKQQKVKVEVRNCIFSPSIAPLPTSHHVFSCPRQKMMKNITEKSLKIV